MYKIGNRRKISIHQIENQILRENYFVIKAMRVPIEMNCIIFFVFLDIFIILMFVDDSFVIFGTFQHFE